MPLGLISAGGCRGPRTVSLKSLSNPIAFFKPARIEQTVTPNAGVEALPQVVASEVQLASDSSPLSQSIPEDENDLRDANEPNLLASGRVEPAEVLVRPEASAFGSLANVLTAEITEEIETMAAGQGEKVAEVSIQDVLISATESFPAIREARLLRTVAVGNQIAALGEFDDKLEVFTINQPLGFYENYRHGINLKTPLTRGGTSYVGYQIGDGNFEPWYGERETNEGGEFKAGFSIPLLQNRAIDARRTFVRLASLDIQRANPELFQQVLSTQYEAAGAYWDWIAAAKQYQITMELMRLAEERVDRIEKQIKAGDVATIVGIDNRRLLALRREKLIETKQKLDSSAIKLSLYYRDSQGRPVLLSIDSQPTDFPPLPTAKINVDAEVENAIRNRPELEIFGVIENQTRAELRLAINQRLPEISFGSEISQDVGGLASPKGDKQPFKLEAGLIGSVPVQRRKAIGKAQALRAKLAQIDAKRQLAGDKIANEVRQAITIYDAAQLRLEQARITKDLARQTLRAGEISFAAGDIDILLLNIYEQAFADAGADVIHAQADLLTATAMLTTATGRSLLAAE